MRGAVFSQGGAGWPNAAWSQAHKRGHDKAGSV